MAKDELGILAHLQLTHAAGELIEALTKPGAIPGTLAEQEREVRRRTDQFAKAYNTSLRWAKRAAKQLKLQGV